MKSNEKIWFFQGVREIIAGPKLVFLQQPWIEE
jgi:hypothetical protein